MANEKHLKILKEGVDAWNEWRDRDLSVRPDLSFADLNGKRLVGIYFTQTDLTGVELRRANLRKGYFIHAKVKDADFSSAGLEYTNFEGADLRDVRFTDAKLEHSNFRSADISGANMESADLYYADFSDSNLSGSRLCKAGLRNTNMWNANLSKADLSDAHIARASFNQARLEDAIFTHADINQTTFADVDLRRVKGLNRVKHRGPSHISIDTLYKSGGKIPEAFLRGCGLSDWQIETAKIHNPDLSNEEITNTLYRIHNLRAHQALQISPLFISYSHKDSAFVDRLGENLNAKGVRFWRDIHDATSGRLEKQIDRAIRLNPTVLLILSVDSIKSDWVEHEVRLARKLEIETRRDVLCPVALDDSWKTCRWPERLREQIMEYNIIDFSGWQDFSILQAQFTKLVNGLSIFYE